MKGKRNASCIAGWLILASSLSIPVRADEPTAQNIASRIRTVGASSELKSLVRSQGSKPGSSAFDAVLDRVQQGNDSWLRVAAGLYPATDAGTRFALLNTVSAAIQNNPKGVLRLTDTVFRIDDICKNRLVEPSASDSAAFEEKTKAALHRVQSPALLPRRDACIKLLS